MTLTNSRTTLAQKLVQVVHPAMGNTSAIGIVGMAHPAIIPAGRGLSMLDPENLDDLETVEALLFTEAELEECIGGNLARMDHGYPVDKTCLATTKRGRRCLHPPLVGRLFCALHATPENSLSCLADVAKQLHRHPRPVHPGAWELQALP